ncbi:MAG: hypothetical protein DWQ01_02895 [Planctomycetota bacterium]|nr:MAG: hypothetical protein DWQ01_02895 [Planctomycetota bacterium]
MAMFAIGLLLWWLVPSQEPPAVLERVPKPDDLNLAAALQPIGSHGRFRDPDYFHWGASLIQSEDGTFHLFYSRWPRRLGFQAWLTHSEIARAVSSQAAGPYQFVETVLTRSGIHPWEKITAHNPKILVSESRYFLYYISTFGGYDDSALEAIAQSGYGHAEWKPLRNRQRTGVATANSLAGPWLRSPQPIVQPEGPISNITVNPAVCRRPQGDFLMIVKGDKPSSKTFRRNQAVALGAQPQGPFQIQAKPAIDTFDSEDVSLWYDASRRRYYAIYHAHDHLGLLTSTDSLQWQAARHPRVSEKSLALSEGGRLIPDRLERPYVFQLGGQPLLLCVAVKKGADAYTALIPFKP